MVAAGEHEAPRPGALGSLEQVQGGVVVGLYRGLELDIGTVGTGKVQHGIDALAGLADEGRVGQVADQGGFIGGQLADRPAIQQA
ncbi:hypothetical protein D3C73_1536790 [compost metagenome]